jgi:RNA polymerase sigma-70 factor (ECF subfamily)
MDETISKARGGDREAMAALVREHYAAVYRFCVRRLGPDLGQDAAQETFVTMQKSLKKWEERSSLQTWLLGIAHNHCRKLSAKRRLEPLPLDHWFEAPKDGPENEVADRDALRYAIGKLSSDHREVVLLHEIEGLRYAEIAGLLGIPEGTVKSRLHHAFRQMRDCLAGGMA